MEWGIRGRGGLLIEHEIKRLRKVGTHTHIVIIVIAVRLSRKQEGDVLGEAVEGIFPHASLFCLLSFLRKGIILLCRC